MSELALIASIAIVGLALAGYLARWVLARPAGDPELVRVAAAVRAAAEDFHRRQSGVIGAVSAVLGGAIFLSYGLLRKEGEGDPVPALELGVWLTTSFAVGAASSVAAGRVATWIATRASAQCASAAKRSVDLALRVALRGGAVSGLFVPAAGLLGQAGLFAAVLAYEGAFSDTPGPALALAPTIPLMIVGHALGASFAALLAQLGGGTFSKAADLGADAASREVGLPEDDPNNPATVADLAGDSAGECAGRSAALFSSIAAESVGAMLVAAALFRANTNLSSVVSLLLFPLVARAFGLLGSAFAVMAVKTDDREDPFAALARGLTVALALAAVGIAGTAKWLLGNVWLRFFACSAVGMVASLAFLPLVQHYTEAGRRPVREIAEASRSGAAFTVLFGIVRGLEAAVGPLLFVVVAAIAAHAIGLSTGLVGGGLFGIASMTVGLLAPVGYLLAIDAFSPVVDSAAGIVEMCVARDRPDVRGRTALLTSAGATSKAIVKVHAAAGAALSSVLLTSAYLDEARRRAAVLGKIGPTAPRFDVTSPAVQLGAVVGIALVLWLVSASTGTVARSARRLVDLVRRQLDGVLPRTDWDSDTGKTDVAAASGRSSSPSGRPAAGSRLGPSRSDLGPGGHERQSPDGGLPKGHATGPIGARSAECLELVSRVALRGMILPAVVAAAAPVVVGLGLRFATSKDNPLVAADSVAALVVAGTAAGVLGSLLLGAGAAWDNAKKYILTGAHGGRYLVDETGAKTDSPAFAAVAVGDAVGDPLKDAAGPAMVVLVKMLSVITIVFLPFFL